MDRISKNLEDQIAASELEIDNLLENFKCSKEQMIKIHFYVGERKRNKQ